MNSRSPRSDGARPHTVVSRQDAIRDHHTVALHGGVLHLTHLELTVSVPERSGRARVAIHDVNMSAQAHTADIARLAGHPLRTARQNGDRKQVISTDVLADPLIHRLSEALAAAHGAGDRHGALQADALRLAVVVRLLAAGPAPRARPQSAAGALRRTKALQKWRLKRVLDHIDRRISEKVTLVKLAKVAGLSRMHFAAQFRTATGMSPHEFITRRRVARAQRLFEDPERSIADVAMAVGFRTQSHFTAVFKQVVGQTPNQWRMMLEEAWGRVE